MRRQYQSDLDEDAETEGPGIWRVIAWTLICLLVLATVALAAQADDTGEPPCVPTVSDYDNTHRLHDGLFAIIWWCDEQDGLDSYWWTDSVAKSTPATVLAFAARDPDEFRAQLSRRWSTVDQITLAMELQAQRGPRCFAGEIPVSCLSWRILEPTGRMCEASGQIQADGSRLPAGSWLACELRKAPAGGWQ